MTQENNIKLLSKFHAHEPLKDAYNYVSQLCFSPDNTKLLVTSASHKELKIMDVETGTVLHTVEGHNLYLACCDWSPDGNYIATGSVSDERAIKIWDAKTLQCIQTMNDDSFGFTACCFSPNSEELLTGTRAYVMQVWDFKTGTLIKAFPQRHGDPINNNLIYSANGKLILSSAEKTVLLWDRETAECIKTFRSNDQVFCACFSADEKQIFSGSRNKTWSVWNIETEECIKSIAHEGLVGCIDLHSFPTGTFVLTTAIYAMKVWNATTGECVATLKGEEMDNALKASKDLADKINKEGIASLFFPDPSQTMPIDARCAVSRDGKRIACAWNDVTFICDSSAILK